MCVQIYKIKYLKVIFMDRMYFLNHVQNGSKNYYLDIIRYSNIDSCIRILILAFEYSCIRIFEQIFEYSSHHSFSYNIFYALIKYMIHHAMLYILWWRSVITTSSSMSFPRVDCRWRRYFQRWRRHVETFILTTTPSVRTRSTMYVQCYHSPTGNN